MFVAINLRLPLEPACTSLDTPRLLLDCFPKAAYGEISTPNLFPPAYYDSRLQQCFSYCRCTTGQRRYARRQTSAIHTANRPSNKCITPTSTLFFIFHFLFFCFLPPPSIRRPPSPKQIGEGRGNFCQHFKTKKKKMQSAPGLLATAGRGRLIHRSPSSPPTCV